MGTDSDEGRHQKDAMQHGNQGALALPDRKLQAAELLALGKRPSDVADALNFSRQQLWRWRKEEEFQLALQELRDQLREGRQDRLWGLVDGSLEVAEELVREGDPQAAMQILRMAGPALLRPSEPLTPVRELPDGGARAPSSIVDVGNHHQTIAAPAALAAAADGPVDPPSEVLEPPSHRRKAGRAHE